MSKLKEFYATGNGATFRRIEHWPGEYNGRELIAEYAGRVTWADGDRWERPEWVSKYLADLRHELAPLNVYSINGDKGYVHLYITI